MTLIYFILILGITIFIHELGHFIWAKKSNIYDYEFSIGMGPAIKTWKRKNDETEYSIRLFPIGGYVSMAGEEMDDDDNIPDERKLPNRPWRQRFITIAAGIIHNFILALVVFFIVGLVVGASGSTAKIVSIEENTPAYKAGLEVGDKIIKLNGKKVDTDSLMLKLAINDGKSARFTVKKADGSYDNIVVKPEKIENEDKTTSYKFGFGMGSDVKKGILPSIGYAFRKFKSLIVQMFYTIAYLATGKLSFDNISGPVGIYTIVGETAKTGFINVVYLLGYISLNVGFMNFLPIPAFDGGRLLFLIIEKIKRKRVSPRFENTVHAIGMAFLLALMIFITYNDIVKIFF